VFFNYVRSGAYGIILALVVLLFAACTPAAVDLTALPTMQPNPTFPGAIRGFIANDDGSFQLVSQDVCMEMQGDAFWAAGEFWNTGADLPTVNIEVNGEVVPQVSVSLTPPIFEVSDGRGGTAGSHPAGFSYCFTLNLSSGSYTIDVIATTRSGRVYQYFWDFRVG
jgi:hypothetical protein